MSETKTSIDQRYLRTKEIIDAFTKNDKDKINQVIEEYEGIDGIYTKIFFTDHGWYIKYKMNSYEYKNRNMYNFYNNLLDYKVSDRFISERYYDVYFRIINELSCIQDGLNLLYKMSFDLVYYMKKCSQPYFEEIVKKCARVGTYGNFMILYNSIVTPDHYMLLVHACLNTDERILKFLLTKTDKMNSDLQIKQILKTILFAKYKERIRLKRIRMIYNHFNCKSRHILSIIDTCPTFNLALKLLKFYNGNKLTFDHYNTITYLIKRDGNKKSDFLKCIGMLNPDFIIDFLIECVIVCKTIFSFDYYKHLENYKDINIMSLSSKIDMSLSFIILDKNDIYNMDYYYFLCDVVRKCSSETVLDGKIVRNYKNKKEYFFYVPFIKYFIANRNDHILILLNKRRFYLKTFIKKKSKQIIARRRLDNHQLMNEIVNYKPYPNVKVLRNGSLNYRMKNQRYNILDPKTIKLDDLIGDTFIIRRKTSDMLTETIEEVDFKMTYFNGKYLVFDCNDSSRLLIDRKNLLLESSGEKEMSEIKSRKELLEELEKDANKILRSSNKYKAMKSWLVNRELLEDIKDLVIVTPVNYNRDYILI